LSSTGGVRQVVRRRDLPADGPQRAEEGLAPYRIATLLSLHPAGEGAAS
jgi:hypothetical protein